MTDTATADPVTSEAREAPLRTRILLVEDEAIIAMDLAAQLEECGYEVCGIAADAAEAWELAARHWPHLILMDVHIKGTVDGIDAAAELIKRIPPVPVIFLTSFSDPRTVERAAATSPYGYLTKPYQIKEVRAAIEVALAKHNLERTLKESEYWLAATLRGVADGVVSTYANGLIRFMNPAAEWLTGWTLDEARGCSLQEVVVIHDSESGRLQPLIPEHPTVSNALTGHAGHHVLTGSHGQQTPIEFNVAYAQDPDGTPLGTVISLRDISERLRAESERRTSEERFRSAFSFAPGGMALVNRDGLFIEGNAAMATLLNCWEQDLPGHSERELTHPDDRGLEQTRLAPLLSGHVSSVQFEKRYRLEGNEPIWVLVSVTMLGRGTATECLLYQVNDLSERKDAEHRLALLSNYDPLTGLANRARLRAELERQIMVAQQGAQQLAVVFIDLDHFKHVNDTMGHEAGDELIKEVSLRLRHAVRDTDCVARLGGDEFVVLLTDIAQPDDVNVAIAKIQAAFTDRVMLTGTPVTVEMSMGVSMCPQDAQDAATLLRYADSALYHAKSEGRNNAQFYSEEQTQRFSKRLALDHEVRQALQHKEFELFYQPIISLAEGKPLAAEALIRWRHPQRGLVPPIEFIPFAEESGLIVPMGEWVVREACHRAAHWRRVAGRELEISVNVSSRQFRAANLLPVFEQALADSGLPPHLLCAEITEQMLLDHSARNMRVLDDLRKLGVKIAIDDFGVGHSSLNYIRRFRPEKLKIDRSFISQLGSSPEDEAMVQAILTMSSSLQMPVVAEGVETAEQAKWLKDYACAYAQGYLYAKPMPAAEFEAWLAQQPR